jgi:hypothetical protein
MEKALMIQRGQETLVSAREMQKELHGMKPRNASFICPLCRQPLFPAAWSSDGKQTPHFRHERNNKRAHECELFASTHGYLATYQRPPLPLFIRRSLSSKGAYIVEGGFRELNPSDFSKLENEGASIVIARKRYRVTRQRFQGGLTKIPFDEVALKFGPIIRLEDSSLTLDSTWGYPEDANRAMVFTRDPDSGQGKRVNTGDTLVFGSDYYLLAPQREDRFITSSFSRAKRVGFAGSRSASGRLSVFEVSLSKDDDSWQLGRDYLVECGFGIEDTGDTPVFLWPPALSAGGELVPLFVNSRCVFKASAGATDEGKLFVHTNADVAERVKTIPLQRASGSRVGYAVLQNAANLSFVTTRNWVFSSAVLLRPSPDFASDLLNDIDNAPVIMEAGEGRLRLLLKSPGRIVIWDRKHHVSSIQPEAEAPWYEFSPRSIAGIKALSPLGASLDELTVFFQLFGNPSASGKALTRGHPRKDMILAMSPDDRRRAESRKQGSSPARIGLPIERLEKVRGVKHDGR